MARQKVDSTLEAFDGLLIKQREVASRSRALHGSCETLVGMMWQDVVLCGVRDLLELVALPALA